MGIAKKILIAAGIGFGALALFTGKKAVETKNVVDQLKVSLKSVSKFPQLFWPNIRIPIDIAIKNPTNTPLNLQTSGLVKLTKLLIYNKEGKLAATALPNLDGITIPANSEVIFKKIPLESSVSGLINTLLIGSTNPKDFKIVSEFEAFGKTFFI